MVVCYPAKLSFPFLLFTSALMNYISPSRKSSNKSQLCTSQVAYIHIQGVFKKKYFSDISFGRINIGC